MSTPHSNQQDQPSSVPQGGPAPYPGGPTPPVDYGHWQQPPAPLPVGHKSALGTYVYYAQWVAVLLVPIFLMFGRFIVGSPLGWGMFFAMIAAVPIIVLLLIVPIISVSSGATRRAKSVSPLVAWASVALWALVVVMGFTFVDGGDSSESVGSGMTRVLGASQELSGLLFVGSSFLALVAYATALVGAIIASVRKR